MTDLTGPAVVGGRTAPSRVVFGPHETNLGDGRAIGPRHVAYYAARAAGGAGVLVTEVASVHPSDWPYERAPSAADSGPGWRAVVDACRPHGTVVLAGLGHAGGQGSSAFSQAVLWAPSPVADVVSREMPMAMGRPEIDALVEGFAAAARLAAESGLDGVELDAGPLSILRQFHSGLTNQRDDAYGGDRLLLTREVLAAVRWAVGPDRIVALRLTGDELAPWAGVTPEHAADQVAELAGGLDLLTVVRGGPYSATAYRPDAHAGDTFNRDLCAAMRRAAGGRVPVVLQGSVVDPATAQVALDDGIADLVEMTRAQIADPRLVAKVRAGQGSTVRPCILCNQACRVRDNRNPLVSCVGEPRSGHETEDPDPEGPLPAGDGAREVLVVGAGPAGLECARVLALQGRSVRVVEREEACGGALRVAATGPGRERLVGLTRWLESECERLGVPVTTATEVTPGDLDVARAARATVVLTTGGRPSPSPLPNDGSVVVLDAAAVLADGVGSVPAGAVVVHDTVGGPVGVGVAEWLAGQARDVSLVTGDPIAGTLLSLTGDLADANTRLQQAGVRRELRSVARRLVDGHVELEDVWTGATRRVPAAVLVRCGHRLPDETLYQARPGTLRAGDCVAPRSVLEAVLEGRRIALQLCRPTASPRIPVTTGATP